MSCEGGREPRRPGGREGGEGRQNEREAAGAFVVSSRKVCRTRQTGRFVCVCLTLYK